MEGGARMMVRELRCCNGHLTLIFEHEPRICRICKAGGLMIVAGPLQPFQDSFTHLKG